MMEQRATPSSTASRRSSSSSGIMRQQPTSAGRFNMTDWAVVVPVPEDRPDDAEKCDE